MMGIAIGVLLLCVVSGNPGGAFAKGMNNVSFKPVASMGKKVRIRVDANRIIGKLNPHILFEEGYRLRDALFVAGVFNALQMKELLEKEGKKEEKASDKEKRMEYLGCAYFRCSGASTLWP